MNRLNVSTVFAAALLVVGVSASVANSQTRPAPPKPPALIGRWDIVVHDPSGDFPSWLEVKPSGPRTLIGQFVAAFGSARPISQVKVVNNSFEFSIPVQFEDLKVDQWMRGAFSKDAIHGTTLAYTGKICKFDGVRAPTLERKGAPVWGTPIELFDGKTTNGWRSRDKTDKKFEWVVKNGILTNLKSGTDIVTTAKFRDFKVHAEFRYPKGSNSGIYLRGRYEAQIEDNYGMPADSHQIGGIYGFLQPRINAAKKAGEWQTYDITLVGRFATVMLNGETVITNQEIPGITGGALDSREGEDGPLLIQGDHGPIEFRRITLTPAK
ncbi:MAG: DUF1080 domain-containing protein [Chthonomonadales bacterium]